MTCTSSRRFAFQRSALVVFGSFHLLSLATCANDKDRRYAPGASAEVTASNTAPASTIAQSGTTQASSATNSASQDLPPNPNQDAAVTAPETSASEDAGATSTTPIQTTAASAADTGSAATSATQTVSQSSSSVPSATASASGAAPPGCGDNFLLDGGFEQNSNAWLEESTFAGLNLLVSQEHATLTQRNVRAHSGTRLAWLGGTPDGTFNSYYTALRQRIQLPVGLANATLSGYIWIVTAEPDVNQSYDGLFLEFVTDDADESLLAQFTAYQPKDATHGWLHFEITLDELNRLSGQTVLLRLNGYTDQDGQTDFFLDDLSLVLSCGH